MAKACFNAARLDDALKYLEELIAMGRRIYPAPDNTDAMFDLARVYLAMEKHRQAISVFEEVLAMRKRSLGLDHPDTLVAMSKLAEGYRKVNRNADATALMEECLPKFKEKFGADHPYSLDAMNELGTVYLQSKQLEKARSVLKDCFDRRTRVLGEHWLTGSTQSQLGGVLTAQKKYAEAERLLLSGYETMAKQKDKWPPIEKLKFIESLTRLVQLYEAIDNKEATALWKTALEKLKKEIQ